MDLRTKLLTLLGADDYVPMRREEVANVLKLDKAQRRQLWQLLERMLEDGEIARLKKDRLCIPEVADLISGSVRFRQSGSATLFAEPHGEDGGDKAYAIRAEDTATALHGDTVLARLLEDDSGRRGRRGPPTDREGRRCVRIIQDFLVPDPRNSGLRPPPAVGDKVVVRLVEWKQRHLNPAAEFVEVLGKTHEPDAEFRAILHKYELEPDFPPAVIRAAEAFPEKVGPRACDGRMDCRGLFTFTIDPDDAKDFDDALSVEELGKGSVRVGVHIADVAAYVKPDSPLDAEAKKRGNSTYLVGTVIPMLPHALSNGLCSLVEAEDRLAKCVFLTFTAAGELSGAEFANTVIRSDKRLTYRQALAFLQQDDLDKVRATPLPPSHQTGATGRPLSELDDREMHALRDAIRRLWKVASKLRKERFSKGSLDLDMPEVKIYVDRQGYADRIEQSTNDESHQLIEEFMLAANEQVARRMKRERVPCVYRVHEEPDEEKLAELKETMATFGVSCGNLTRPREMNKLLGRLKDHPQGYTLRIEILRSLKQARYEADAKGHYGLAKRDYTHFTSPIRRYADLLVHRAFDHHLAKSGSKYAAKDGGKVYPRAKLESISEHVSLTERNSTEAERESAKTKLLEFYERELQKPERSRFPAVVTDVKNHGMFVELADTLAFGLVHISTLDDDLYNLNGDGTALVGRRHRRSFSLGQRVTVEVARVDRFKRQIDFRIAAREDAPRSKGKVVSRVPRKAASRRGKGGSGKPPPKTATKKASTRNRSRRGRR